MLIKLFTCFVYLTKPGSSETASTLALSVWGTCRYKLFSAGNSHIELEIAGVAFPSFLSVQLTERFHLTPSATCQGIWHATVSVLYAELVICLLQYPHPLSQHWLFVLAIVDSFSINLALYKTFNGTWMEMQKSEKSDWHRFLFLAEVEKSVYG